MRQMSLHQKTNRKSSPKTSVSAWYKVSVEMVASKRVSTFTKRKYLYASSQECYSTIIFNFNSDSIKMEDIVTVYNTNSIQAMDILAREVILQSKKALHFHQAKTDFTTEFHINAGRIKPSGQQT